MTASFFFLFFTTTSLKINHNFYSETSVLVLGIRLRTNVHSAQYYQADPGYFPDCIQNYKVDLGYSFRFVESAFDK